MNVTSGPDPSREADAWQALGERLASLRAVDHPLGQVSGERLTTLLQAGTPAHVALAEAGAPARVVRFVERAAPRNLIQVLDGLVAPFGCFHRRARSLAASAWYVWVVAAASALAVAVLQVGVVPAMDDLAHAGKDPLVPLKIVQVVPLALSVLCIAALAALGLVLGTRRALFPFARARLGQERALVVGAAAAAARAGVNLATALQAAAELTVHPQLRGEAEALAASLEKGAAQGGALLLGELGAALFAGAAAQGVGPQTLSALADFEEAAAEGEWPTEELKAELLAVLLGGLAVVSAGAALMLTYSGALIL